MESDTPPPSRLHLFHLLTSFAFYISFIFICLSLLCPCIPFSLSISAHKGVNCLGVFMLIFWLLLEQKRKKKNEICVVNDHSTPCTYYKSNKAWDIHSYMYWGLNLNWNCRGKKWMNVIYEIQLKFPSFNKGWGRIIIFERADRLAVMSIGGSHEGQPISILSNQSFIFSLSH